MQRINAKDILYEGRNVMRRDWVYKVLGMLLCSILVIMAGAWAKEDVGRIAKESMPSSVQSYLEESGITHYEVKKLPEPKEISKRIKLSCAEREIDEYIAMELENYDSLKDTKKEIVQKGDFIRLEFSGDKSMKDFGKTVLKVGKNLFDARMEKALPGKRKGKIYSLQSSDNQKVYVRVEAIVKYVKQNLSSKFLKEALGFVSEDEYRAHVKEELLEGKKQMQKSEAMEQFFDQVLSKSVVELDREEVADFCMDSYVKNEQQMAVVNNESFEKYIQEMYHMEKEEYYEKNYAEGERALKEMIVVGVLASRLSCNQGDYQAMREAVADYYIDMNFFQ